MQSVLKYFLLLFLSVFLLSSCEQNGTEPIPQNNSTQVSFDIPNCRKFVQRNNNNEGEIFITGSSNTPFTNAKIKFKNFFGGQETGWLPLSNDGGNKFSGSFTLKGGGYYPQVIIENNNQVLEDTLMLWNFKVGEIFAVVGHSLAEGQDPYNLENFDKQWCEVIKWDEGSKVAFWGRFADLLKTRLRIPVMVYNTGIGGSTSVHWGNSAFGLPFVSPIFDWKQRYPYKFFENRILNDFPKSGIRGIFIMHGENDIDLTENEIVDATKLYIQKTRDLLNKPDLTFWMAKCNRGTDDPKEIKVRSAQKRILSEIPNVLVGADLQSLTAPTYRWDGTHFNMAGVENAAIKWNEALLDAYFSQTIPMQRFK
ncbi:MAG: hypothetical protein RL638_866 [Bacteroidota bacterium]|jgi:hypothetical protein